MKKPHQKYYFNNPPLWDAIQSKRVEQEIKFIKKLIKTCHGKKVLDVGCGSGIHLKKMQDVGFSCVGIDLNKHLIAYAKKTAPGIDFRVGDMRKTLLAKKFDVIICICGVFAYNKTTRESLQTLSLFSKMLKQNGVLVLDNINAIGFIDNIKFKRNVVEKSPYDKFGLKCSVNHRIITRRQSLEEIRTIRKMPSGRVVQRDKTLFRLFFPEELSSYLESTGFKRIRHYSGFSFHQPQKELRAFRLVTVAQKK